MCPDTEAEGATEPCDNCPLEHLNWFLRGPMGRMVESVIAIDFALQVRMNVSLNELSWLEFNLLRALAAERQEYQERKARTPNGS